MVKAQPGRRPKAGWIFLSLVGVIYAATAAMDPELARRSAAFFVANLAKVIPVLVIVFLLMFVFDYALNPKRVKQYLGQQSGPRGWVLTIAAGILSTGPVYAWYALLSELRKQGMSTALMAAFLFSRAIKMPLLPLLVHYFGLRYTLVLSFYLAVFSVLSGLVMGRIEKT
jgi:uncharacterized membrane protein YraQ (UPF0718 family)